MTTFATLLDRAAPHGPRPSPGHVLRPREGERVELSVTTYANWVAKAASLLGRGARPRARPGAARRPAHALAGPGLPRRRVDRRARRHDAGRRGRGGVRPRRPRRPGRARAADLPVLACSLLPMGVRFADPLPPGVHDVGIEVWSQPDAFTAWDPPGPDDLALPGVAHASCGERPPPGVSSPTAAVSSRRRTRLPHRGSPPSPSRSHAAARWSWSSTPTRGVSRRRTSPSAPRPASLERGPGPIVWPGGQPARS